MNIVPGLSSYNTSEELSRVPLFVNYSDALLKFASVCCGVLMFIGIPGNLITIIALARYQKVQNATATFIINLHISDLLFCCTVLPIFTTTYSEKHWVFGKTVCRLFPLVRMSLYMVGMFLILAISINRCIMVCHPLWYIKVYTKRNIRIMVVTMWVAGCIVLLPTFFGAWGQLSLDPKEGLCTEVPDKNGRNPKTFLLSTFAIPCIVMQVCYTRIWWVSRKSSRKSRNRMEKSLSGSGEPQDTRLEITSTQDISENCESSSHLRSNTIYRRTMTGPQKPHLPTKKDKRLGTMILVIMVTFYLSSLPLVIFKSAGGKIKTNPEFNIFAYIMLTSTTSINPIIYVVMSREYRQAYKSLFKGMKNKWQQWFKT